MGLEIYKHETSRNKFKLSFQIHKISMVEAIFWGFLGKYSVGKELKILFGLLIIVIPFLVSLAPLEY